MVATRLSGLMTPRARLKYLSLERDPTDLPAILVCVLSPQCTGVSHAGGLGEPCFALR